MLMCVLCYVFENAGTILTVMPIYLSMSYQVNINI